MLAPPQLLRAAQLLIAFLFLMAPLSASAQPLAEIQRQMNEIQQQQRQLDQIEKDRVDPRLEPLSGEEIEVVEPDAPEPSPDDTCFDIREIELSGADDLSNRERERLTAPYLNRCIGLNEIRNLLRDVTNHYVSKGFVTTRAYMGEQDLASGRLEVLVVEGRLDSIELDSSAAGVNLTTAFPFTEGKLLQLRDLEQGLDQINRLPSNNATMQLVPADEVGGSKVMIFNERGRPVGIRGGVDNVANARKQEISCITGLRYDNLLRLNDMWNVSYRRRFVENDGDSLNQNVFASASAPFGYWSLFSTFSWFEAKNKIVGATRDLHATSESTTFDVVLDRVVSRGSWWKSSVYSELELSRIENTIEDVVLLSSSPDLSILSFGSTSTVHALQGVFTVNGQVDIGLNAMGATNDPGDLPSIAPHAQYVAGQFGISYSTVFSVGELVGNFSSSWTAQWSQDYLYGIKQIPVGGQYTVRGFQGSVSGNSGFYARNHLGVTLPRIPWEPADRLFGYLEPYLALDFGGVEPETVQPGGFLTGLALGLRSSGGIVNFNFSYAWGLSAPSYYASSKDAFYFAVNLSY